MGNLNDALTMNTIRTGLTPVRATHKYYVQFPGMLSVIEANEALLPQMDRIASEILQVKNNLTFESVVRDTIDQRITSVAEELVNERETLKRYADAGRDVLDIYVKYEKKAMETTVAPMEWEELTTTVDTSPDLVEDTDEPTELDTTIEVTDVTKKILDILGDLDIETEVGKALLGFIEEIQKMANGEGDGADLLTSFMKFLIKIMFNKDADATKDLLSLVTDTAAAQAAVAKETESDHELSDLEVAANVIDWIKDSILPVITGVNKVFSVNDTKELIEEASRATKIKDNYAKRIFTSIAQSALTTVSSILRDAGEGDQAAGAIIIRSACNGMAELISGLTGGLSDTALSAIFQYTPGDDESWGTIMADRLMKAVDQALFSSPDVPLDVRNYVGNYIALDKVTY